MLTFSSNNNSLLLRVDQLRLWIVAGVAVLIFMDRFADSSARNGSVGHTKACCESRESCSVVVK